MKRLRVLLIVAILALAIGGGFAPWVYRPPVALQLTPPGLAEYVKFLREVRLGVLILQRLYFLLPLAIAAYSLPLLAVNDRLCIDWRLNWLLRFSVIPMALSLLSPIWAPTRLINDEFRLQTIVAGGALGLALIAFVFKRLPLGWLVSAVALASVVAVGLALQQFYLANEAIAATYASPVGLGWGGWLAILGASGLVVSAIWVWLRDDRMMKLNRWLLGLIILILFLIGRGIILNLQGRAGLAEIQRRGILRVGLDASFPPFEMLDDAGNIIGLDADIAQAIGLDLGVEVAFVNIGFDGLYDALKADRVDMLLSGLPVDPRLTQDVAYSLNYFNAGQVLVTTNPQIQAVDDLAGQIVAVEWGSQADLEARRLRKTIPNLAINPQPDPQAALQFDIAIVDGVTALSNPNLRLVEYLSDDWYAAAVAVENRALLAKINQTLRQLTENALPPCYLQIPRFGPDYSQQLQSCYHWYRD